MDYLESSSEKSPLNARPDKSRVLPLELYSGNC